MVVKKKGKSALDYDPLSWLKGDEAIDDDGAGSDDSTDQQVTQEKAADNAVSSQPDNPVEETAPAAVEAVETASNSEQELAPVDDDSQEVATETAYLVLETELTMKNVAEIKHQLDEIMRADTPVSIDADALRKIDSAGLQMLYSLQKTLKKNGASINWKRESEVIKTAAGIIEMDFDAVPDQKSIDEIEAEQGFGFF